MINLPSCQHAFERGEWITVTPAEPWFSVQCPPRPLRKALKGPLCGVRQWKLDKEEMFQGAMRTFTGQHPQPECGKQKRARMMNCSLQTGSHIHSSFLKCTNYCDTSELNKRRLMNIHWTKGYRYYVVISVQSNKIPNPLVEGGGYFSI